MSAPLRRALAASISARPDRLEIAGDLSDQATEIRAACFDLTYARNDDAELRALGTAEAAATHMLEIIATRRARITELATKGTTAMNRIRDYDPAAGQAFQGDVAIVPVPAGVVIDTADQVKPFNGRLILQEGEVTGHHHGISIVDPPSGRAARFRRETNATVTDPFAGASPDLQRAMRRSGPAAGTAHMYRDRSAAEAMVRAKVLARSDLCVGFLVVEGGPVVITHDEHDGIRVPEGRFYIGRQVESAGAEERRVSD